MRKIIIFFILLLYTNIVWADSGEDLFWAAEAGDLAKVEELIENRVNIIWQNSDGVSVLMQAAASNQPEILNLLLRWGAYFDLQDNDGWTALMWAAERGHTEIVELLINAGAEVDWQDDIGKTALMLAASYGQTETVVLLISKGVDLNIQNRWGYIALVLAARNGQTETVELLINTEVDVYWQNDWGSGTALIMATRYGHTEIAKIFLSSGVYVDLFEVYLNKDFLIFSSGSIGTALMSAAMNGDYDLMILLLKYGADVNLQDEDGWTALICAVYNNHIEIVRLLITSEADLNIKNNLGNTALDFTSNRSEIGQLLIANGEVE